MAEQSQSKGAGIFIVIAIAAGTAVGSAVGQPSAGVLAGVAAGGAIAFILWLRDRNRIGR